MVVAYYAIPVGEVPSSWDIVFACVGLLAGLGVLVLVTVRQLRGAWRTTRPAIRACGSTCLALVVFVVVPLFALGYYALEQGDRRPVRRDVDEDRRPVLHDVDAGAPVGFGDVHATGQLARVLVTFQIAFDLVFVGGAGLGADHPVPRPCRRASAAPPIADRPRLPSDVSRHIAGDV